MHRLIAIVLGFALVAAQNQAAALHVHVYADHDHPEHHHGPAAHEHVARSHAVHDDVVMEPCGDPGRHAVSLVLDSAALAHPDALFAVECPAPSSLAEPFVVVRVASTIPDTRVHGPPLLAAGPPRAPPLISHS